MGCNGNLWQLFFSHLTVVYTFLWWWTSSAHLGNPWWRPSAPGLIKLFRVLICRKILVSQHRINNRPLSKFPNFLPDHSCWHTISPFHQPNTIVLVGKIANVVKTPKELVNDCHLFRQTLEWSITFGQMASTSLDYTWDEWSKLSLYRITLTMRDIRKIDHGSHDLKTLSHKKVKANMMTSKTLRRLSRSSLIAWKRK